MTYAIEKAKVLTAPQAASSSGQLGHDPNIVAPMSSINPDGQSVSAAQHSLSVDHSQAAAPLMTTGVKMFPWQVIGAAWLLVSRQSPLGGGVLADETSLGKTTTALAQTIDQDEWERYSQLLWVALMFMHAFFTNISP